MRKFGSILSVCYSILALVFLIGGVIDHATFCAVLALLTMYISDKYKKKEAK